MVWGDGALTLLIKRYCRVTEKGKKKEEKEKEESGRGGGGEVKE